MLIQMALTDFLCRLFGLLDKLAGGKEKVDMERMGQVIHRRVLEAMSSVSKMKVGT